MFRPLAKQGEVNAGKPALGRIQSDGTFVLRTYAEDDGAVVGTHLITVIEPKIGQPSGAAAKTLPNVRRVSVPGSVTVVAGQQNEFDVRISAEQLARFGTR